MKILVFDRGKTAYREVYQLSRVWGVIPTRKAVAAWKRQGGIRAGSWWPIHSLHATKQQARTRIADAVANREWPRGALVVAPVACVDGVRHGIFT